MASQRITVAKIGGVTAEGVARRFEGWTRCRFGSADERSSEHWPAEIRREAERLVASLRTNRDKPPILFFSEHVDLWSMADDIMQSFDPARPPLQIETDRYDLCCYELPDNGILANNLKGRTVHTQEMKWLTTHLSQALQAWDNYTTLAVIILIREVIGGLVTDDECEAALHSPAEWLDELGLESARLDLDAR